MVRQSTWGLFGFGICFLLLAGCGRTGHDRTEVTGMVTLDGKLLPSGLTVKFTPEEPGTPIASGTTDSESRYTAYAVPGKIGLVPGSYTVSVERPFTDDKGTYTGPPSLANVKIPDQYQTGKSMLTFTVPGDGHTFDIQMSTNP